MLRNFIVAIMLLLLLTGLPAAGFAQAFDREVNSSTVALSGILEWEANARSNFRRLIMALPRLPAEISAATGRIEREASENGFPPVAVVLGLVLLASLSGEWITRRFLHRIWHEHQPVKHNIIELLPLMSFMLIGVFLYFSLDWPPLTGVVLFFYLASGILFRFVWAVCATARAKGALTSFMLRRSLLFSGILLFGVATNASMKVLLIEPDAGRNASIVFSLLLLTVCLEAVWHHATTSAVHVLRRKVLQTIGLSALWLLWFVNLHIAFWISVYAIALPIFLPFVGRLTKAFIDVHWEGESANSLLRAIAIRGVRAVVISVAVLWLIAVWQYYPPASARLHSLLDTTVIGLFKGVIVLLVADLGWSVAKVTVERKLASVAERGQLSADEIAHRARLRTLLPIFRNALGALVLVVTALTVLGELGMEIGPLIAGAGIFGVAIGFGSQTLVKDVISGVFYLMDDAFRVGEYVQSGSYMGTVESFSLRSVRLRHHRGAIFTVPFGELGAVQNMSRDWAIDKFSLRLALDADISAAKKLVKEIGSKMLEDPELGPLIIEPLKFKGVEQISEVGIEVSFTFTAVPGNQSMIRRSAQAMIREAFLENGVSFSHPTLQFGGLRETV